MGACGFRKCHSRVKVTDKKVISGQKHQRAIVINACKRDTVFFPFREYFPQCFTITMLQCFR